MVNSIHKNYGQFNLSHKFFKNANFVPRIQLCNKLEESDVKFCKNISGKFFKEVRVAKIPTVESVIELVNQNYI